MSTDAIDRADRELSYEQARAEAEAACGRINILIAGNTGVGKSTLINAVFGDGVAPSGSGAPVTRHIVEYRVPEAPLNLFDTRGFEAGDDEALRSIGAKLDELHVREEAGAHIHIAWLCIASSAARIEPAHLAFLADLRARHVPCIVVLTKSSGDSMLELARELAQPSAGVVELLAAPQTLRNGSTVEPFGVEELVEQTYAAVPEGLQQAFSAAQQASWPVKKAAARRIVHEMALQAGGHGANPIPLADMAGVYFVQKRMLARIDLVYGLKAEHPATAAIKQRATGVVSGLGNLAKVFVAKALSEFTLVGTPAALAAGAAASAAATTALGYAYIEAIARYLPTGEDLPVAKLVAEALKALGAARPPAAAPA